MLAPTACPPNRSSSCAYSVQIAVGFELPWVIAVKSVSVTTLEFRGTSCLLTLQEPRCAFPHEVVIFRPRVQENLVHLKSFYRVLEGP